ncbi:uncharacterized protein LOC132289444 [Cornus florida]|uniref:uncharacterized protein LOC132289444 n=1 Tax=Cornus florida TaxID=4283 RepID=UPI0028A1E684|nr:uncharacterized protein LOC132289444 [Cornus florida]
MRPSRNHPAPNHLKPPFIPINLQPPVTPTNLHLNDTKASSSHLLSTKKSYKKIYKPKPTAKINAIPTVTPCSIPLQIEVYEPPFPPSHKSQHSDHYPPPSSKPIRPNPPLHNKQTMSSSSKQATLYRHSHAQHTKPPLSHPATFPNSIQLHHNNQQTNLPSNPQTSFIPKNTGIIPRSSKPSLHNTEPTKPPTHTFPPKNFNPLLYDSPGHQIERLQEQLQWSEENLGKSMDMHYE